MSIGIGLRTVSAGLAMVLAAASGACSPNGDGSPAGATEPPRDPLRSSSTAEPDRMLVLGPDGVGPIKLGMTPRGVEETGAAETVRGSSHDGWPAGCVVVVYRPEVLGVLETVNGSASMQGGVEQLSATDSMATPDGIGLGSSIADVRAAYRLSDVQPGDMVVLQASATAVYRIQLDPDVVTSVSLELRTRRCVI